MGLGSLISPRVERPAPGGAYEIGPDGSMHGGIYFTPWAGLINDIGANATPVTQDVAEGIPGVGRGVDLICGVIAQLQPLLYRNEYKRTQAAELLDTPSLLLNPDPSWHYLPEWLTAVAAALCWHGNAYAWTGLEVMDARGFPSRLPLIPPEKVFWDGSGYRLLTADSGPQGEPVADNEILHMLVGARAGKKLGEGILTRYQTSLQIMLATEKAQWVVMRNGKPMGIISLDLDLTPEEAREYKADFMKAVATDGIAAMGFAKFSPVDWSSQDLSMIPTREFNLRLASDVTGVPPYLLGVPAESRVYSNQETEWTNFIRVTLGKYLSAMEHGMSECFPRGQTVAMLTEQLTRPDITTRWNTYKIGLEIGALTLDEVRAAEGLAPLPEPVAPAIEPVPEEPTEEA